MHPRLRQIAWLLLAVLLAVQSLLPTLASAEATMRCAGASPARRPCARIALPAAGVTPRTAYAALMACCRSKQDGCAMRQGCETMRRGCALRPARHAGSTLSPAVLAARRCLVSVRLLTASRSPLVRHHSRWLLIAPPALAPPVAPRPDTISPELICSLSGDNILALPSRHQPKLHGLRAPPVS